MQEVGVLLVIVRVHTCACACARTDGCAYVCMCHGLFSTAVGWKLLYPETGHRRLPAARCLALPLA